MGLIADAGTALSAALSSLQENRFLKLSFPHGDGPTATLLPNRIDATEGLSTDFRYEVELLSNQARIALKDVEGRMVTLELSREDGSSRYFNGYAFEFRLLATDGGVARYLMVLRPWLSYLDLRRDNYAFHDTTLEDQTRSIFEDYESVADWRIDLSGNDQPVTYACQFAETDYNYLHRRWEAAGWHYRWEHRKDGHTLVIGDDTTQSPPIDGDPAVPWQDDAGSLEDDGISGWTPARRITSGSYSATSFDFKQPKPRTLEAPSVNNQGEVLQQEVYDYLGAYGFKNTDDGDRYVRLRMEELEARGKYFEARGNDRFLAPGRWFRLTGHFDHSGQDGDADSEFLIISIEHRATNNYLSDAPAGYENTLTCLRRQIVWRPGPGFNSNEPRIQGPQTAIVVGPKGEEIHTDKYGRVKVQFHWDRIGQYDDRSSAWIRVVSNWTGKGYGFVAIPRVGQEVVVSFLDGNPDRPLVTGCVYNEENLPAWGFPAAAHQTGIQSRSTPGGGGMCEMVIHDKAGSELINIHSQKDMTTTVLNDLTETVKNNRSSSVTANDSLKVTGEQSIAITGKRTLKVTGAVSETFENGQSHTIAAAGYTENITGDYKSTLTGNYNGTSDGTWKQTVTGTSTRNVDGKVTETLGAGREINIKGDDVRAVEGAVTDGNKGTREVSTEGDVSHVATGTFEIGANGDMTLGSGTTIKLGVGETGIVITSQEITLSCGGSTVVINAAGVTVNGAEIKLN